MPPLARPFRARAHTQHIQLIRISQALFNVVLKTSKPAAKDGAGAFSRVELPVPVNLVRADAGLAANVCVQPDAGPPLPLRHFLVANVLVLDPRLLVAADTVRRDDHPA